MPAMSNVEGSISAPALSGTPARVMNQQAGLSTNEGHVNVLKLTNNSVLSRKQN
jgi:hypothetical protein